MTDVTSEKLYSKLERINNVKRNFKKVMIAIGGYEYFQNDPKFETYPEILSTIHTRIAGINRILDISIYGRDPSDVLSKPETTYSKIMPYLDELQYCRSLLIDNLNTKGVTADTTDTLRTLVGKVLDIQGGGIEPFNKIIATQEIPVYENLSIDWHYVCDVYSESGEIKTDYYIYGEAKNYGDETVHLIDPCCCSTMGYYDSESGDGLTCSLFLCVGIIEPHETYRLSSYITTQNEGNLDELVKRIESGDSSVFFEVKTCPPEEQRVESLNIPAHYFDGAVTATYYLHILRFSDFEYMAYGTTNVSPYGYAMVQGNFAPTMLSPDGERQYRLGELYDDWFIYNGDYYTYNIMAYDEQSREDLSSYMTNEIVILDQ